MTFLTKQNKPSLRQQASEASFKMQFVICALGLVGVMKVQTLGHYFPVREEEPHTKWGCTAVEDVDLMGWPDHRRAVEHWFLMFRINLFMRMAMFPQLKAFDLSWNELVYF